MPDCLTVSTNQPPLTPNKRVNYSYGMVLGEKEFRQEHEHLDWKGRLGNRLLHGSGTVCGLHVSLNGNEVRVASGYAVDPQGRWLWVERDQCARLDEWLGKNAPVTSPMGGRRTVYVKLCYHECPTDAVPIAGHACASEDETRAASRILETARAEFSWTPPTQPAADHAHELAALLSRVETVAGTISPDESELLIDAVRHLGRTATTSPPLPLTFRLSEATACDTLRRALAVWVTEVRPRIGSGCVADTEGCVLLARLEFNVDTQNRITGAVNIVQDERPYLLPTRVLQELLLCGQMRRHEHEEQKADARHFATLFQVNRSLIRVWIHYPNRLNAPPLSAVTLVAEGTAPNPTINTVAAMVGAFNVFDLNLNPAQPLTNGSRVTLTFDATQITEVGSPARRLADRLDELPFTYLERTGNRLTAHLLANFVAPITAHSQLSGLSADDHPQYLNQARGDARYAPLTHNHALNGLSDVTAATTPANNGHFLMWNGTRWIPAPPPTTTPTTGPFVEHPPSAGPYFIVAAGLFRLDGRPQIGESYNELKVVSSNQTRGEFLLHFDGYENPLEPSGRFLYVVKGTIHDLEGWAVGNSPNVIFHFVRFEKEGILVRIGGFGPQTSINPPQVPRFMPPDQLKINGFMVEVSAYPKKPL